MMTTGRAVIDPDVVQRQNELVDLYNGWGDDPDDDPEFVDQAREIMGLPPLEGAEEDFPALRSELAYFDDDEVARALTDAFSNLERARYGSGAGERIAEGHVGGGRFRKLTDRLTDLLEEWARGEGPDDPLDGFSREQLRDTAKKLADKARADGDNDRAARLTPRRMRPGEDPERLRTELKVALYRDVKASRRGERDVPEGKPEPSKVTPAKKAAPKKAAPPAADKADRVTPRQHEIDGAIREAYARLKGRTDLPRPPGGLGDMHDGFRESGWVSIADLRDALGEKYNRHEVDDVIRRLVVGDAPPARAIPQAARHGLMQRDHDAALRIGDADHHWFRLTDSPDLDDPEALRDALDLRKVPELKDMLRDAGLPVSGRKRELVDRLVEHRTGGTKQSTPAKKAAPPKDDTKHAIEEFGKRVEREQREREAAALDTVPGREKRIADTTKAIETLQQSGIPEDNPGMRALRQRIQDDRDWLDAHASAPDAESKARSRQAQIDAKRKIADGVGEVLELLDNGVSPKALRHRISASGLDDESKAKLLAAVDPTRLDARVIAMGLGPESDFNHGSGNYLDDIQQQLDSGRSPTQVARYIEDSAQTLSDSTGIRHGGWQGDVDPLGRPRDPDRLAEQKRLRDEGMARVKQLRELADRVRATKRPRGVSVGDAAVTATARDLASSAGLTQIGAHGTPMGFDPKQHTFVGEQPRKGQKVALIRPGYVATIDGEPVVVSKAKVETWDEGLHGAPSGGGDRRRPTGAFELPAGVTDADYRRLVDAYRRRRDKTGIPGADNRALAERASVEANSEWILRHFQEWNERQIGHLSISEAQAELGRRVRRAFADRQVATNLDTADLKDVLRDRRFKTQFETGDSGGVYQPDERRFREGMWFGLPDDTPPEQRPIYGYLVTGSGKGKVDIYGDAQVILRPEVRGRTTAMVGDSMENILGGRPSPVDDPEWFSFTPNADTDVLDQLDRNYDGPKFNKNTYIEAQVHGGVTLDDIAEVVLSGPPDAELKRLLEQSGIKWRTRQR